MVSHFIFFSLVVLRHTWSVQQVRAFLAAGLCFCVLAAAQGAPSLSHSFSLDTGVAADNVSGFLAHPQVARNQIASLNGFIRGRWTRPLIGKALFFQPSLGVEVPWMPNADGNGMTLTVQTSLDIALALWSRLLIRGGIGARLNPTVSLPGTVTLNNGGGTSSFYTPGGLSVPLNLTNDFGLSLYITPRIGIHLDAYVLDLLDSSRREICAMAGIGILL